MTAFVCGWCAMCALWCGADWLRERKTGDAVGFWFNIVFAVANGLAWLSA